MKMKIWSFFNSVFMSGIINKLMTVFAYKQSLALHGRMFTLPTGRATRDSGLTLAKAWRNVGRGKYIPHQGKQEIARRRHLAEKKLSLTTR